MNTPKPEQLQGIEFHAEDCATLFTVIYITGSETPENRNSKRKQEVSLKKIIVEGNRAVGSLNGSFQSLNFLLLFFIDFGQW